MTETLAVASEESEGLTMGLFRPKQARQRPDGSTYTYQAPNWRGRYRDPVNRRRWLTVNLETDNEKLARQRWARFILELEVARSDPYHAHAVRPLREHLDEYEQHLRRRATRQHVGTVIPRIRKAFEACGFVFWPDIRAERVEEYLADLTAVGLKGQTVQHTLTNLRSFGNWMVRRDRAAKTPLAHVSLPKAIDSTEYRALSDAEVRQLLDTTLRGPTRRGMSGRERHTLYLLALETGFRVNELRTLTWQNVRLDEVPPIAVVEAAYSKHRECDTQPLKASTAAMLGSWREALGKPEPASRVFPGFTKWVAPSAVFGADCAAARSAWIKAADNSREANNRIESDFLKRETPDGRAVFHSLRHTFISNVDRVSTRQSVVQRAARHKDPRLTDRYTHVHRPEIASVVDRLPELGSRPDAEPSQKTGTADEDVSCAHVARASVPKRPKMSVNVHDNDGVRNDVSAGKHCKYGGKTATRRTGFEPVTFGSVDRCSVSQPPQRQKVTNDSAPVARMLRARPELATFLATASREQLDALEAVVVAMKAGEKAPA